MRNINLNRAVYWIVFSPVIIPLSMLLGAFEGVQKTLEQAQFDLHQVDEPLVP